MFEGCSSLEKLDLSNFNSPKDPGKLHLFDMYYLFDKCISFKELKCSDKLIKEEYYKLMKNKL